MSALTKYPVQRIVRSGVGEGDILLDTSRQQVSADRLEGVGAVVHLAGEGIANERWTSAKKQRIRDSRILGTRLLATTLAGLTSKPATMVCASAIGYYGDRGSEVCSESSDAGDDFLAHVCQEWEEATEPARAAGIRVVNLRIGVVLSRAGGALHKMLPPFRWGVGGPIGDGKQFVSWISLTELVQVILFCVETEGISGPANAVAPNPVTNQEFTKTLGRLLSRPTVLPLPQFAARLMFGEMADALLLSSTRVTPLKLQQSGYQFTHPLLEDALNAEL